MIADKITRIKNIITIFNGTIETIRCNADKYSLSDIKIIGEELRKAGITGGRIQRIRKHEI